MDTFAQLNADFWLLTFGLIFIFGWVLAIAAIWKAFAFFRDIHSISESLKWIVYAQRKMAESTPPAQPQQGEQGTQGVAMSQFGR